MNWKTKNQTGETINQSSPSPIYITQEEQDISPTGNIRVIENKILFYSDIDQDSCLELNKTLIELDLKLQTIKLSFGNDYDPVIHLHINSAGGEVFSIFSTIDTIKGLKSKVYTYVDGYAASAATLLSCVGDKRFIGKYGHMMIHQVSGEMYGKFHEIQDSFNDYKNIMKLLKEFYKTYSKVPMKKLDEILKHDITWTAEECLNLGLVDEIL